MSIIKIKGTWEEVVDDCRSTVSKPPLGKEPSQKFKEDILIAEHSPIRDISIKWKWENIKSWIATHWSRHKWECFIQTQRTDRTGKNRDKSPQDTPVTFTGEANTQAMIDTMRKRLCYQAAPETRECAENLKEDIKEFEPEISNVLVPNCIYRCGCPELYCCGLFQKVKAYALEKSGQNLNDVDIKQRYALYNEYFYTLKEQKSIKVDSYEKEI